MIRQQEPVKIFFSNINAFVTELQIMTLLQQPFEYMDSLAHEFLLMQKPQVVTQNSDPLSLTFCMCHVIDCFI